MPHIVMEHSDNLTQAVKDTQLLKALHQQVVDSGLFSPEAVKARSMAYSDYVLPDGGEQFAHITCAILDGRNEAQRMALSEALFFCAKDHLPDGVKLSVNIHEMNKATYKK